MINSGLFEYQNDSIQISIKCLIDNNPLCLKKNVKKSFDWPKSLEMASNMKLFSVIELFTDSDAILKILSVDFCGKVKVNSDSSCKIV